MESTETPLNTMLISKINSINDVNTLNDLSLELTNYISTLSDVRNQEGGARQKKARIPKMNTNPQKININNAPEIQGLYKNQKHRAVQEVLFGPTKYCMIEGEKIEKHFSSKFSKTPVCKISELPQSLWDVNDPSKFKHHDNKLTSDFKTTEVRSKLLSKIRCDISNSRSVGLDRLRFSQLLKIDKNCELLTAFYNACLRVNSVPKNWNETYSVLVKINENEDDNPDDLKNWKSITMYNTIPKLFYALLAARLYVWGINSEKISSTQRSYKLDNAACESSFLLQECKNYVNLTGKNLIVSWLNFADAAESIPQSAVLYVLQKFAVPEVILNIIKTAFNESETMIRVSSYESKSYTGFTEPIKIINGMLPGNPLNPVLLSLVMEPLLKSLLIAKNDTIQIYKENINHFVMCNELTLFTDSVAKMNNLLTLVNERAKLIGIKFKNDKSSILHYCGKNNQVITTESFVFNNQKLRILSEDEMDKFFGVKQALRIAEDVIPTLDEMKKNIELINESKLDSYQKIDSVNKFIYPRVENYFKGLQEIPDLQSEDEMLKLVAKKWLDLPDKVSDEVIILPAEEGGAGFYPLKDLINIMKIVHAFKMFTSEYETVKLIAFNSLKYEVSLVLRIPVEKISTDQMTDYLSGNIKLKKNLILNPSTWQITRKATVNLKEKINVSWKYNKNLEEMQLKLKRNNRSIILRGNYRSNVIKKLKDELVFFYTNELNKSNPGYKSEITIPDLKKKRSNKRKYSKRTGRRSKRTTKKVVKNQENNAGAQQVPLVTQNLSVQ